MGVAGSGKTTIGKLLAERLHYQFLEGDDLHPPANRRKMESRIPLNDDDRWPWLDAIVKEIQQRIQSGGRVVATCSALKREYRKILRTASPEMLFVHLKGNTELIASRIATRKGHFFPPELLASQLKTLETPIHALEIEISSPPEHIVEKILSVVLGSTSNTI